ncbi:hypothetical protein PENSPDRAFT_690944 [Peniophora sp. CONT]|nr:hypothetical protein PENSPDRAFT_690944 [Peniophora sp. CONT]
MRDLVQSEKSDYASENPEAELARLTWLIVTPGPTIEASSTSASSNRNTISGTIAKDTLLFALEAIVQSSDIFPPLKSVASGLLFFATYADMASDNKKQVRDTYKRIDGLATALQRGAREGSPFTPEHQDAISALAVDVKALNRDLENIIAQRRSRLRRFFAAKRHSEELRDVVSQLEAARMNYMMAIATLNTSTIADVHGHVKAISLVLNARAVPAPGTRRADTVTAPLQSIRTKEV